MLRFWFAFRRAALILMAGGIASIAGQAIALAALGAGAEQQIQSAASLAGFTVLAVAVVVFLRRYDELHPSHATVSRASER